MKVVYKKSMKEKIDKVINEAKEQGKEIEKILLTRKEYWNLVKELGITIDTLGMLYKGLLVEVDEVERKIVSDDGGLTYRVKNKVWGISL